MLDRDRHDCVADQFGSEDIPDDELRQELARVRRSLAATVERSGELIQKAIEAESVKKRFMARISYEIRTPLNAIIGFSEILAQEGATEQQRECVGVIQSSARELLDLTVNSMADFLGVEVTGGTPVPCPPDPVVDDPAQDANCEPQFSGRVVVAEDNRIDRMIIEKLLRKLGLEVVLLTDGEEAVAAIRLGSYDMAFMDMEMPCMSGYEATKELRSLGITIPIVALTGHALKKDRSKCLEAGCNDYLPKPIERAGLLRVLRTYLPKNSSVLEGDIDPTGGSTVSGKSVGNEGNHSSVLGDDPNEIPDGGR